MIKIRQLKRILITSCTLIIFNMLNSYGQVTITNENKMKLWRNATFGMFVHWGAYSYLGGIWDGEAVAGYAEHIFRVKKIPLEIYKERVVKKFNPTEFDAEEWIRILKDAGMRYLVITAKHHDGFAMWDSKVADYDIIDMTPFKRDPMRELRDACKRNGVLFGFYYSHAQDWSHPYGQRNQWDFGYPQPDIRRWWEQEKWGYYIDKSWIYVREKSIPQLRELILNYDPDIIWFDTHAWLPRELTKEIVMTARELKLELIINSRGTSGIKDYQCTNDKSIDFPPRDEDYWEAIPTTNESYGYHSKDLSHKPASYFIQLIAKAAARGGNLLMNVGPMGNGKIDPIDVKILEGIGKWLKVNGDAIYGVERTTLPINAWGESTIKGNILYLHVFNWPNDNKLILGGLKSEVKTAYFLADPDKKKLEIQHLNDLDLVIHVPETAPDTVNTVIVLECKGVIEADPVRLIATNIANNRFHVFDGQLKGTDIIYGSGNEKSNIIRVWKGMESSVNWQARVLEKADFSLKITYTANEASVGNVFQVIVGDHIFERVVQSGRYQEFELGQVTLEPGNYKIQVVPKIIKDGDLFQLTKLNLIPLR
ncbi:MAG: alpha-L-fucosidase [bacterium]|nr:MAG: alpha-L-fucosidase [bacterium]